MIAHDPQHKVAGQFRALAAEVLTRVAQAEGLDLPADDATPQAA